MTLDGAQLTTAFLIFTRVGGVMLSAPALSSTNLPVRSKLGLAGALTVLLACVLPPTTVAFSVLPAALAGEMLTGLVIGLGFRWSMAAAVTAGEAIGLQMGLGVGSIMDPLSGNNATVVERLYALAFLALFFALGGHRLTILVLGKSFSLIKLGAARFDDAWFRGVAAQTAEAIILGVRLAAGVAVPLLILMFAMALIARAFPQANMFTLSFTVSLLAGTALLAFSAESLRETAASTIHKSALDVGRMLQAVAGGGG